MMPDKDSHAPIIVFGYARAEKMRRAIESLSECPEAVSSSLYIYIDGPRTEADREAVEATRAVARGLDRSLFGSVTVVESPVNRGLGPSVISGVGEVIKRHGRAIIVEDDLRVLPNFLRFMNSGLDRYADDPTVFSICGYTNKVKIPSDYAYDAYLAPRSSSWGWATWADRWQKVHWEFDRWDQWRRHRARFNAWGGSDCFSMLDGCRTGANRSWAIRFCFAQYLDGSMSLFPVKSLVVNDGFDGSGDNCRRWSRFRYETADPAQQQFRMPPSGCIDRRLVRRTLSYHSLSARLRSRLMYLYYDLSGR